MSILVICAGCQARFSVDEKFAGKQGPCPKCQAPIRIPSPDDVKIHEPEPHAVGGKNAKGRPTVKPIARDPSRLTPVNATLAIGAALVVLALAWGLGQLLRESRLLLTVGTLAVAVPVAAGAYSMLREPELEPYRGRALWLRAAGCGAAYAALWGAFYFVPEDWITGEAWMWLLLAPPFVVVGGLAAMAAFDFEFTTGTLHYGAFLLVSLVLRWVAGMAPLWNSAAPGG